MSTGNAPKSVKEIWEQTIVRFQQRTGQRLDGVSKGPDDLRKALDAHYAAQADDEKVSKAKDIGFKMIHCIQLLGGIAAEGASMVFAPAGLCFNALSFLLDIPKKVHEFHGEINAIFAEVGPALAQFRIYQRMEENTQIDEALRMSIYQVMTSFVDLCANCINIHHEGKWKSFKRNAKRVLLDDGSVQGELDNFKKLTQDQLNIQATLTLEVALETNQYVSFIKTTTIEINANAKAIKSDVSGLVEAERKRTLDDNRKKYLTTIKTKLGQKDEQIANVLDARDEQWKNSVKDSGKWLNEVDMYKQWLDKSNSSAEPLLFLTGDPGTGKSFLVSGIAQEIKSGNSATKAERSLVGYYSFSMAGKGDSDRQRPEAAIKSICAQLADQDIVYARHVSGVCGDSGKDEKYFKDATCQDLWKTLSIGAPAKNTAHYILLDSVTALSTAERERLMEAVVQRPVPDSEEEKSPDQVRVLVSGEPKAIEEEYFNATESNTIDITQYNEDDITAFIVEELKKADLFQAEDEDSERRRTMVEDRLLKRSNHSYSTVTQDLGKIKEIISSSGTEEELNRVLQESSTDPESLVRSDLETLETVLKAREIEEINELLIWAVAGHGLFDLNELEAALFLRFNTVSLQPLLQKITGKYSKIFTMTSGEQYLSLRDYVEDCVVAERDRPRQSADDPKITATITITNGDVKAVQRFFWDLNHYSFLDGFAFRPGTDHPNAGRRKIQLYTVDAHLEIVKRSFDFFLQASVDERGKGLGRYLIAYLPHHLGALYDATGLDELQPADKQYIGTHIYEMFNEGDLVEKNWEFCEWVSWFGNRKDMEIFWKWLSDPVATGRLGPRDKRWLAELKKEKNYYRSLLTPIMTVLARNWLQDSEWDASIAYRWIAGFLGLRLEDEKPKDSESKEEGTEEAEEKAEDDDEEIYINNPGDSTAEMIAKAEKWCQQVLKVQEVDYTWCIRLGTTYADLDESAAASEQYLKAAGILQAEDPVNKEKLRDVFKSLGEWATDPDDSLEYFKKAYEQDETNVDILYPMLKRYVSSGKVDEARPVIQKALTEKAPDTVTTPLISMLKTAVGDQNEADLFAVFSAIFSLTSSSPEMYDVLRRELKAAIENSRNEEKYDDLAIMLLHLGSATYFLRKDSTEELACAVDHWRECVTTIREKVPSDDQERLSFIEQRALSHLNMFYYERAINSEGEEREANAEKLREFYADDKAADSTKYILASFYTFTGQREKSRELLRPQMVTAFNILFDDDIANDWEGFLALRSVLNHTGDYENALRAALLLPTWRFDHDVVKELIATEGPEFEQATAELLQFSEAECIAGQPGMNYKTVSEEAKRICDEAAESSMEASVKLAQYGLSDDPTEEGAKELTVAVDAAAEKATAYEKLCKIFNTVYEMLDFHFWCNNCKRYWDFENALHACKYCHDMDLCDVCWNDLRSGETGKVLACSKSHDWWECAPWTVENYVRACNRLISVQAEDGSEELISPSKWLGMLCDEWGLPKSDWDFE